MKKITKCLTLVNMLQVEGPLTIGEIIEHYREHSIEEEELNERQFYRYKTTIEKYLPCKLELNHAKYSLVWDEEQTNDKNGGLWGRLLLQTEIADVSGLMLELKNKISLLQPISGEAQLRVVLIAIKKGRGIHGIYDARNTKKGEEPKIRTWIPIFVALWDSRWYVVAECISHPGSLAVYALERFSGIRITKDKYYSNTNYATAKQYFQNQYGIFGPDFKNEKKPIEIKFRVTNKQLKYMMMPIFHSSLEILEKGKTHSTISMKLIPNINLYQKILSFGTQIEVLSPEFVRYEISNKISEMNRMYV